MKFAKRASPDSAGDYGKRAKYHSSLFAEAETISIERNSFVIQSRSDSDGPKEWGWRFIGADIEAANGMLIECYGEV